MKKVIACIDDTARTESVCDHAAWAAVRLQAPLEFLHVLDRHPETALKMDASGAIGLGAQEALLKELANLDSQRSKLASLHGQLLLQTARQRAVDQGVLAVDIRQRHGTFVETLVELEAETRLLVLGKQDRGNRSSHLFLDYNLENAIRAVHQPTLVSTPVYQEPRSFMLAFDGSTTGHRMVETVARSPLLRDLPGHVVIAGAAQSNTQEQLEWAHATLTSGGLDVTCTAVTGDTEIALLEYAAEHDIGLLVMGAYGHSRIRHLIVGSTTTAILRASPVPVLLLR